VSRSVPNFFPRRKLSYLDVVVVMAGLIHTHIFLKKNYIMPPSGLIPCTRPGPFQAVINS
jgi:hypothetical protein